LVYRIVYKKSVERDLKKLAQAEVAKILDRIEKGLSRRPEANPALKGQFTGLRKYRTGDYRVIYALLGEEVLILRISHRREAYRRRI